MVLPKDSLADFRSESDVSEDIKNESLQAEHDRLLALQQKASQKIRELELAKDESRSLLLRALLDRENLSPELLQIKKEETLRRIREQIQGVINAPSEAQTKVLDVTSSDIADTLLQSEAALDVAKKVSKLQLPSDPGPSCAINQGSATDVYSDASLSRRYPRLEASDSAATLVPAPCEGNGKAKVHMKSVSVVSTSTSYTGKRSWGDRLTSLMSPSKGSRLAATDGPRQRGVGLASLTCVWHG